MQELLGRRGTITELLIDTATSGDNVLVAGTATTKIRLYKVVLYFNADNNITFKDGSSTKLMGTMNMKASTGMVIDTDEEGHTPYTCTRGNDLVLNLSAAQQVSGRIWYTQDVE